MLTQSEKESILREFPNLKLSYETMVYKKVYNSDYIVAIPQGKKCFAWFTSFKDKMVCFIMELANNKQIVDIKIANACFSDELSYGTILYGTFFYNSDNKFFSIEDIFTYKGVNTDRLNWGEKLVKLNNMLKKDIKQISYNNTFLVFGLPLMSKTNEDLEKQIGGVTYNIETVQYKLFSRVNAYIFMEYNSYKRQISQTAQMTQYSSSHKKDQPEKCSITATKPVTYLQNTSNKISDQIGNNINTRQSVKRDVVFMIRPDIQNDIYYLHCINNEIKEEKHSIAHIPDYNTSVMMNKLFRIIKENENLDALEESDDEDEFENENVDKFVYLDKSYKMVCQFNHKFKKWTPLKLADERSDIITINELNNIYYLYEENKKKNYKFKK
jgi:hypothetical protein